MIAGAVTAFVICLCIGLAGLLTAVRDDYQELRDRTERLEKLQRKTAVTLAEHELLAELRDDRRAVA